MRSFKKALLLLMCVAMAGIANALPFETTTISGGSFVAGTKYYRMKFIINDGSAQYVYIDSDVKTTSEQSSADLFAFVGDETNGFKIYKKGNASSVIYMKESDIGWSNRKQINNYDADLIYYGSASSYTNWLLHDRGNGYYSFYQTGLLYYFGLGIQRSTAPTTMNYSSSGKLSTWTNDGAKTGDNNCRIQFEEVPTAVTFTYSYIMNDVEMGTESIVGTIDESFPSPTLPAFCSASTPAGTVTASDAGRKISIDVTWNAPVDFSTSLENAKWYLMTAGRDNDANPKVLPVMRYKEGQNYITLKTTDKDFSLSSTDQWAFVGNPFEGFKIYNRFKKGRLISSTTMSTEEGRDTNPYVSSDASLPSGFTELWDLQVQQRGGSPSEITDGFSISQHGQSSKKMNRRRYNNEASDQRLAYWTGGADNGSTFTATQVLPPSLITYNVFESNGYTTLYVDYPIAVTYAKVYTGQRNDAQTSVEMTLATDNIIPANTGVVLVKDGTNALQNQTYTISNEPGTVARGDISGTTSAIQLTNDTKNNYRVFGLSTASPQSLGFFRPSSSVASIPANKAFYDLTGSGVQGFVLSFDGMETGIALDQIMQPHPEAHEPAYDLSGRRVNHAAKGVYIIGGRKVIVK